MRTPERQQSEIGSLMESVSLYLHIPFCQAKCHYCDFNSYAGLLGLRERYVDALEAEIALAGWRARRADGQPRRCRTIFFGGGTPSLLTTPQVARLLAASRAAFALDDDAEITLEANPGAIERGRFDELRAAGINRLSMGAQSFDDGLLRWMGRIHTAAEIADALHAARAGGFDNINLDFIFALPSQTLALWDDTLARALDLGPDHLSLYSLIVEEGTPLHRWVAQGRVRPADDDLAADMYEQAARRLADAGYAQYEISNWARPDRRCQHNLTYWRNLPYIGLGAGAHGWFAGRRYSEARPIRAYCERVERVVAQARDIELANAQTHALPAGAVVEDEAIAREAEMAETAMLGLRLVEGLDLGVWAARFGEPFFARFGPRLAEVEAAGLLERVPADASAYGGGHIRLTERGRLLGNEVFERVLP
ncbi:MAG TPA: radical SAM family heme chaperone HemW [Ktedonobacterales bacterium]